MISVSNLTKKYGSNTILNDISLEVKEGEICGMIGLNGIGKTTFLKCVLGLARINSGNIKIFGEERDSIAVKKKFCFLPERFNPNRYLTGIECLDIFLGMHGVKFDIAKAQEVSNALDFRHDYLTQQVSKYSKGTAQKIGLIGAFMAGTPLILLDEPMTGLDPRARIFLKRKLMKAKEEGRTIFFTSHILSDVEEICDRIIVLDDARIQYSGSPQDFMKKHKASNLENAFLKIILSQASSS